MQLWTETRARRAEDGRKLTKEIFQTFMQRYQTNPKEVHPDLNECELESLAHVNPDTNIDEGTNSNSTTSTEEYRMAKISDSSMKWTEEGQVP